MSKTKSAVSAEVVSTADRNMVWQDGMPFSFCVAKAIEHLTRFITEGDIDHTSGIPHLSEAESYLWAIRDFAKTHPECDDRKKGKGDAV